jgi:hypothetical protein
VSPPFGFPEALKTESLNALAVAIFFQNVNREELTPFSFSALDSRRSPLDFRMTFSIIRHCGGK